MQVNTVRNEPIAKVLAKLFIFFIPFSIFAPLAFLKRVFVGVAGRSSFVFLLLGLLLYVI